MHDLSIEKDMWDNILKETKTRYWLSVAYRYLMVMAIILGSISTLLIILVICGNQEQSDFPFINYIIFFCWIPTIIVLSLLIVLWRYFKKRGGKEYILEPYIVKITPMPFIDFIEEMSITTQLDRIKSGYCSYYERWGFDDSGKILCLISNQDEYEGISFDSLKDRLFDEARELYGLKMISISTARRMAILYINTFISLNNELASKVQRNAKHPQANYLAVYETDIDLSTGTVYIPIEVSTEYGITGAYRGVIDFLWKKIGSR